MCYMYVRACVLYVCACVRAAYVCACVSACVHVCACVVAWLCGCLCTRACVCGYHVHVVICKTGGSWNCLNLGDLGEYSNKSSHSDGSRTLQSLWAGFLFTLLTAIITAEPGLLGGEI